MGKHARQVTSAPPTTDRPFYVRQARVLDGWAVCREDDDQMVGIYKAEEEAHYVEMFLNNQVVWEVR